MTATIEKGQLVIRVDMHPPTPSKTGKTLTVASSHGNHATTAVIDGKPIIIGVNAYVKA